jgi:putative endonuclease
MPADMSSYDKGVAAEKRAVMQLRLQGYRILAERYKTKFGEIDIIARKGNTICFVEVKAHKRLQSSLEAVTAKSRRRIEQAALWFISEHPELADLGMRFDVMAFKSGGIWAEHLDNAWMAGT